MWSAATVFLAYVPWVLHGLGEEISQPWRLSHAIFATYHSWAFYMAFSEMYADAAWRDRFTLLLSGAGIGVLAMEIACAIGWAPAVAPTLYVVAILWFLFMAMTRFILLATAALVSPEGGSGSA
jgi:hypothetical protein